MIKVKIAAVKTELPGTKTFILDTDLPLVYMAGQFLTFLFQGKENQIRRSYSFSSAPGVDEKPAITIKRNSNGEYSRWWIDEAKPGDELIASGPSGVFTIADTQEERDIFFAAAGSGITPIYSVIKWLLYNKTKSRIHLLYSNQNPASTIFFNELRELQENFAAQLSISWFFSENPDLLHARLSTYNLQRILAKINPVKPGKALMFTCGPYDYMKMVQVTWLTMGFLKENFKRELFDINLTPSEIKRYYDKTDRIVTIQFREKQFPILVHWYESILDAALRNNIPLDFNCRGGICSTCICRIISGKVWMHYNEVLTKEEEERGLVLTCTGHPISNNVIIEAPM
jgi:ring-1,2-phenylacetyl-CoA epoxidase subunit PaaE